MIYKWVEHNDWEGETWVTFINVKDDESIISVFDSLVGKFKQIDGLNYYYELLPSSKTKQECIELKERYIGKASYSDLYSYVEMVENEQFPRFKLMLEKLNNCKKLEDNGYMIIDELSYKQQIFDDVEKNC